MRVQPFLLLILIIALVSNVLYLPGVQESRAILAPSKRRESSHYIYTLSASPKMDIIPMWSQEHEDSAT